MARLILKRPSKWIDLARSYKVYVDGQKIGELYDGETKEFEMTPGQHTIKAKIDFLSSKPVHFEVKNDDETKQMLVKNNTSLWLFALIFFIGFFMAQYISKTFFKGEGFLSFVILFVIYIIIIWLFYKIKPYLKIEQVEDLS